MTLAVAHAMQHGRSVEELHHEAHPDMLDPAGKFRLQDNVPVFNLGPHRGQPAHHHPDYLYWMLDKSFAPSTVEAVIHILENNKSQDQAAEDDNPAARQPDDQEWEGWDWNDQDQKREDR